MSWVLFIKKMFRKLDLFPFRVHERKYSYSVKPHKKVFLSQWEFTYFYLIAEMHSVSKNMFQKLRTNHKTTKQPSHFLLKVSCSLSMEIYLFYLIAEMHSVSKNRFQKLRTNPKTTKQPSHFLL
jgi:hypothetical protein